MKTLLASSSGSVGTFDVSEKDFQRGIIDLAQALGYRVAHFRPAQTSKGWRTPVAADGAGWPDLVLVSGRRRRVVYLELKRDSGAVRAEQAGWIRELHAAGAEVFVARPRNLQAVAAILGPQGTVAYADAVAELRAELDRVLEAA